MSDTVNWCWLYNIWKLYIKELFLNCFEVLPHLAPTSQMDHTGTSRPSPYRYTIIVYPIDVALMQKHWVSHSIQLRCEAMLYYLHGVKFIFKLHNFIFECRDMHVLIKQYQANGGSNYGRDNTSTWLWLGM
jgi:hypothetical protein